jgi:hypothetical protein
MKDADWAERLRKRELRIMRREKLLDQRAQIREWHLEAVKTSVIKIETAAQKLREDNKQVRPVHKRPGPGIFLEAYSYIPATQFDKRHAIPASWTAHSFNERRQHREFLKTFVYPYPVPEVLLRASRQEEYFLDGNNREKRSPGYDIIRLAKKWVCDIVSGESFYKRNKEYFTKPEAHWFLNAAMPYDGLHSVLQQWFYARCRARNMDHKLGLTVSGIFAQKFAQVFRHPMVSAFLDLIARTDDYRFDSGILGDISDFILVKIQEHRESRGRAKLFSLSGRTIVSIAALANEWHRELQRRREPLRTRMRLWAGNGSEKTVATDRWPGLGIGNFQYPQDGVTWIVSELRTAQALVNEGRKMRNCVASYAYRCALGECSIFNVSRWYEANRLTDSIATLEVNMKDRTLVQAKGKCNGRVTGTMMNVITRWAQANRIRIKLV